MALTFDANYYLSARPDVFNAFVATAGKTGQTWAQFAEAHYNSFGRFEGSNPNATFNTKEYLAANPDVAAAGVNPFQHFLTHGAAEGRAPNASFPTFASFDEKAYLTANADLGAAGITTKAQAYAHFVIFGQFEGRPGAPSVPNPGTPGSSVVFTTSIDNLVGTTGDDSFTGDAASVGAADSVNGGAGTDTLKLFGVATGTTFPQISNIENVYLNATTGGLDVSGKTGVTGLEVDGVATGQTFTVTSGQKVTLSNLAAATTTTVAGNTPTSLDLTANKLAATSTVDLSGTALATANLTATGDSSFTLTNTGTKLATLNIAGGKNVSITESLTSLTTIDASKATGKVTIDASGSANNTLKFTGGSGNDKIVFAAANLTSADTIDGGAGTDTLQVNDINYGGINGAKNFEILALSTDALSLDIGQITNGLNQFATVGNVGETFTNALSTSKFSIDNSADAGTIAISNKVGDSASTIAIDNQGGAAKTVTAVNLSGITTVALSSTGNAASSNVITTLGNADNSSITITGDKDLTITNALAATTTGSKVDASVFTGALTVVGSGKADIIIGGAGADKITGGAGADTLTGGAGKDVFGYTTLTDSLATTGVDTITDFVAGTDKFDVTTVPAAILQGAAYTAAGTGTLATDIASALTAGGGALAANGAAVVTITGTGAGTYLIINDGTIGYLAADDAVVKLTGLTGTLTVADFT